MGELAKLIKKVWNFIWKSDSVWSWLLNIILAYIFIRFIFYPGIGLLFNTSYPLVAVVSGSMEHMKINHNGGNPALCGNIYDETDMTMSLDEYWNKCGRWYEDNNISKKDFSGYLFKNGFNKGDIIFIYGINPKNLKIGDVIVFNRADRADPIIHRIIDINKVNNEPFFVTKGDHNRAPGIIDQNINSKIIMGKGVFRVPYLGWIKIWFVDLIGWIQNLRN